jgi:hypothetical protein
MDNSGDTRQTFEKTFSTVSVRKYTPILLDLRSVLVEQLAKANLDNPAGFDIFGYYHRFTFDVINRLTFGAELRAQTSEYGQRLAAQFDRWLGNSNIITLVRMMLGNWAVMLIPKVMKEWQTNKETFTGLIQKEKERIERGEARNSIMDYGRRHADCNVGEDAGDDVGCSYAESSPRHFVCWSRCQ